MPWGTFTNAYGGLSASLILWNLTSSTALSAKPEKILLSTLRGGSSPKLSARVLPGRFEVAAEDGDGAGYDVLSFSAKGRERLIEVKTTNGSAWTPFFLTRNECDLAESAPPIGAFTVSNWSRKIRASSPLHPVGGHP